MTEFQQNNLFQDLNKSNAPLAEKMRPNKIEDFCGQKQIIGFDKPLYKAIKNFTVTSSIFWGPPGTGKTTLANIISTQGNSIFVKLNAVSCGVADVKEVINNAKLQKELYGKKTYLLLDECHRFNKTQLDSLLNGIEKGEIIFIGSTTENPKVALTPALLSRCNIFEFKPMTKQDLESVLQRALNDKICGLGDYKIDLKSDAKEFLLEESFGDVRSLLNALELAYATTNPSENGDIIIDLKNMESCFQRKKSLLSEQKFYDILSAFCKSMRGSDPDATIYYLTRLLNAGCDPTILARRIIAHSSEDVGLADSNALIVAVSAMNALKSIGMPEATLSLAHAALYVAKAPKSNSVYLALHRGLEQNPDDEIPVYLKDKTYANKQETSKYKYPHDYGGTVVQTYLPNSLKEKKFYIPTGNGEDK